MIKHSVLLVDDDEKLVQLLKTYFEKDGFLTYAAYDGLQAIQLVKGKKPSIVVLDIMLPEIDGWEVCRQIRKDNEVPIIMLTARDEESDRLIGLEIGADDYVTKPFSPKEVVARAKVVLRRMNMTLLQKIPLQIGNISIDFERHQVSKDGEIIELTATEFKILALLVTNAGRIFTRLQIVEQMQGNSFEGYDRTIDVHIKNLRRKIEDNPREPRYILTVYGVGYKFAED
ncbi:response regulator transcription factor [Pectinatus frisingensis]|uniref:response regulator transcription factor n=1 Tax=Pectinatus frisingensis TaxID=865 RepID=UPI0018C5D33E|nr:response regulator transcription factor [Pectinatus frisingensis]